MSRECEVCKKKPLVANLVSHSKRRTKTRLMPNLQSAKLVIDGAARRVKVCASCLKSYLNKVAV